ncbi:MAG: translation initiation factor IF-3 [Bacteroidaceae bacterium]|nr:translation initiation factor IF-3 [Bacteroidaceae bacterium]
MLRQKKDDFSSRFKVNEEIKLYGNVRIVGEGIESKVVPIAEARSMAESMELDLVLLNTNGNEPVIKLCNYEKMLYEMKRMAKKNKQVAKPLKDIQLSVNIAKHDMETKANNARRFLEDGSRVRVTLTMRGREMARHEENKKSILEFIVMLEDVAVPEAAPRDDGNRTSVILKRR